MENKPIVFKDFGFQYRAQKEPTLYNIDFEIKKGEKVLIVGPSGSGKSTIANCINGLIPFNYHGEISGSLQVQGKEAKQQSLFELSKEVGTVLQDPDGQFVGLTVGEDIAFALENDCALQSEMLQKVEKAAAIVGIEKEINSSPYDLSGGQKQRVSMAGVVIDNVGILLFDEPLANLDPDAGKNTISLIDELQKKTKTTVVIIEHRLEDVLHCKVDRIVLIGNGRIVADMPPNQLLCTKFLQESGIREPLYLTALKYAGVSIEKEMQPESVNNLVLSEEQKQAVNSWFENTHPKQIEKKTQLLLKAENLQFAYDEDKLVLQDVSFEVNKGEMLAIVGTNGAGKSTLAKLICGFEMPAGGTIHLNGESLENASIAQRAKHVGYVMQNPNQMISKTMIFDEVAFGLRTRNISEEDVKIRVEETLKICGLYQFRSWPISALSFGQKKRVTIASVLVMRPEIIILDEPTAGQDFKHYTEIMEFLQGLNKQGVTVLMITHDMHLMLEYAPRALVFSGGKLLVDDTPANILTSEETTKKASLKQTSLYMLAQKCKVNKPAEFVQHFIDYDRQKREEASH